METTVGNGTNIKMSKMLTITIGANNTQVVRNLINTPAVQKFPLNGLISKGTINSVMSTPMTKWIASGNWTLDINNGYITSFETNMLWNNINGTNPHTHELLKLKTSKLISLNESDSNVSIKGIMDVGTNNRLVSKNIPSTIDINDKTISILVDDNMTNHHFSSQPILGMVSSFVICSDIPGPNIEVLPFCSKPDSLTSPSSHLSLKSLTSNQTILLSQQPSISADRSQVISTNQSAKNCESITITNASASGYETDPNDYNPPAEAIDGDLMTWWANKGVPSWLEIQLQKPTTLCAIEIAWNKGDERTYHFTISTDDDNDRFTEVFKGKSTGNTESYEKYDILNPTQITKSIKFSFTESSSKGGWVSIREMKITGK